MLFKRIITGALALLMVTSASSAAVTAAEKSKKTDYHAFAAELDKTAYDKSDLGATYSKESTVFKVWSPKADSVKVNIFNHGSDDEGDPGSIETKAMTLDKKTGVWSVTLEGDYAGKYYTYSVKHGESVKETGDIYARACGVNGKRSMILDLSQTNPEGWENDAHVTVENQTDATVWEISVADFSSSESSGVTPKNRGKFLAFTESGTTVDGIRGNTPTCVDYLKKLGVKYVQIMPFYDFGSVDESEDIMKQYNWGYDPVNYNCPEGSYSTDPYDGSVRIKECKQMIQALHEAGIGVIMDVVYNHTYSTDSWFEYTVPNYYYRMNEDGTFSNGSGCSNDTASEHAMFRKYMIDSVTYWAKEYHIDGFRFDLMGLHDVDTMNAIRAALDSLYEDGGGKKLLMYGEAWNLQTNCAPGTVMANQTNMSKLDERIGAFDDTIRDAIKGSTFGAGAGFVQEGSGRSNLKIGIAGQSESSSGWAKAPSQCVTYASCHDNLCLYDKLIDTVKGSEGDYRKRYDDLVEMNKLAGAIVITSQGIPFMLGGEEFARTKDGDENSFSSSRDENMLDWKSLEEYSDLIEYYRGLYKIRDKFAAFRDSTSKTANSLESFEKLPKGVSGYFINNTESGAWDKLCLLFNGSDEEQSVSVEGEWTIIANDEFAGLNSLGGVSGKATVKPHSALILVDKKSYEAANITDHEGKLKLDYFDADSKEHIKTQVVSDEIGKPYDIGLYADSLNYDIKSTNGNVQGEFSETVSRAEVYVKEFEGKMSQVTVRYIDDTNGEELADSFLIKNREGQQYFTPELPSIDGYNLVLNSLPDNAAGKIKGADSEVLFKYTRITDDADTSICRVNLIYLADNGKILDVKTLEGKEGEEYSAQENEYEDMNLIEIPKNSSGVFKKGEINVLFCYTSQPDPYADMLVYIYIGVGVILALCVASAVYRRITRKKSLMSNMDVVELDEGDNKQG